MTLDRKPIAEPDIPFDAFEDECRSLGIVGPERPAKKRRAAPPVFWLSLAKSDAKGQPLPTLENAMTALRSAPQLADVFEFDEMERAPILKRALPVVEGSQHPQNDVLPRPVRDTDVGQLQEFLQRSGLSKLGKETTHQAVDLRAVERSYHPVREYLNGLRWDGRSRLESWLTAYLGAADTPYHQKIGAMFFVGAVARIFKPGCKLDYVVILEGPQGAMKSTACRILGGTWFSDSLPELHSGKDVAQHLRGKWIVEIPELSAVNRAEAEALKAFVSRAVEQYRPSYGRREVTEPRQCVFIGTTNRSTYLKDETGGRRFWPVKVATVDAAALERDRDQLFAEAVVAFRRGDAWWPDAAFEREFIHPEQEARFDADPWTDPVRNFLRSKTSVLVGEIARECLHFETNRVGTADQRRITSILISLQWQRAEKKDWRGHWPWTPA